MKKNISKINWEKAGVYVAIITLVVIFASKIVDLSERISNIEGKLQILVDERNKK